MTHIFILAVRRDETEDFLRLRAFDDKQAAEETQDILCAAFNHLNVPSEVAIIQVVPSVTGKGGL